MQDVLSHVLTKHSNFLHVTSGRAGAGPSSTEMSAVVTLRKDHDEGHGHPRHSRSKLKCAGVHPWPGPGGRWGSGAEQWHTNNWHGFERLAGSRSSGAVLGGGIQTYG